MAGGVELTTAFSRETADKVYVQHKLKVLPHLTHVENTT